MNDDTEYLQIRHAARFAGVGETTVRGWIKRGLLPIREVGGLRLISRADLVTMLEGHRVQGDAASAETSASGGDMKRAG